MHKILNLASLLTTFCTLVFISPSFATELPLSKFVIKRLQIIVNEQGYKIPVNGRLDTKTNELIRKIFKIKIPDKSFSYQEFLTLKRPTKLREKSFTYENFRSTKRQTSKNKTKYAQGREFKGAFSQSYSTPTAKNIPSFDYEKALQEVTTKVGRYGVLSSEQHSQLMRESKLYKKLFNAATMKNDPVAAFKLGQQFRETFRNDLPSKPDTTPRFGEAAKWYIRAAKLGHAKAHYALGRMYDDGLGVPRNAEKHQTLYILSTKYAAPNTRAMWYSLAKDSEERWELKRGGPEGAKKFLKPFISEAIESDNARKYRDIGLFYRYKGPIARIPNYNFEAAKWFVIAVNKGNRDAMYELGMMYGRGFGVKRNMNNYWALLEKASALGHPRARKEIRSRNENEQIASDKKKFWITIGAIAAGIAVLNSMAPQSERNLDKEAYEARQRQLQKEINTNLGLAWHLSP